MSNSEINKRDHNYSESECSQHTSSVDSDIISSGSMTMSVVGQIKDIDELKKIAPRVRLQDAKRLNELARISSLSNNNDKTQQSKPISKKTGQELKKYCRTCAGLKVPLVYFFLNIKSDRVFDALY